MEVVALILAASAFSACRKNCCCKQKGWLGSRQWKWGVEDIPRVASYYYLGIKFAVYGIFIYSR